jgi:tRNA 2-thiouridine synthesizing protein E
MPDIRKFIEHPETDNPLRVDHELDLQGWDEEQGRRNAKQEGIELTDEHLEIVHWLRDYYLEHGPAKNGRELGDMLDEEFADRGGRKYLRRLFPNGPVAQGMRIAGLSVPPHTENIGFGTSR